MKNLILASITLILLSCSNSGEICNNPNCRFDKLTPPLVLVAKTYNEITLRDSKGKIWHSSTQWEIAKSILVAGYAIGDTIK